MKNSIDQLDSTNSITLVRWDATEIAQALRKLGANESIIAKATVSFLVKIPGAVVSCVEWGFQVGNSFLPVWVSRAVAAEQNLVQTRWQKLMAIPAANDASYAQVA
jgi:hypothetical protein